jgi:hypothetical protein
MFKVERLIEPQRGSCKQAQGIALENLKRKFKP